MRLLTKSIAAKLRKNWDASQEKEKDHAPVVKFFDPWGSATWLITEMSHDEDTLFGLCDLGFGTPELGYVSLRELRSTKKLGHGIERDRYWKADKPLSHYTREARSAGRIAA